MWKKDRRSKRWPPIVLWGPRNKAVGRERQASFGPCWPALSPSSDGTSRTALLSGHLLGSMLKGLLAWRPPGSELCVWSTGSVLELNSEGKYYLAARERVWAYHPLPLLVWVGPTVQLLPREVGGSQVQAWHQRTLVQLLMSLPASGVALCSHLSLLNLCVSVWKG